MEKENDVIIAGNLKKTMGTAHIFGSEFWLILLLASSEKKQTTVVCHYSPSLIVPMFVARESSVLFELDGCSIG